MAESLITVEVAFAAVDRQALVAVQVPLGTTLATAIELSGIAAQFPQATLADCPVGIFGKRVEAPERYVLEAGDRVEIYRPLIADPMEVRRLRAAKTAKPSKKRG